MGTAAPAPARTSLGKSPAGEFLPARYIQAQHVPVRNECDWLSDKQIPSLPAELCAKLAAELSTCNRPGTPLSVVDLIRSSEYQALATRAIVARYKALGLVPDARPSAIPSDPPAWRPENRPASEALSGSLADPFPEGANDEGIYH